MHLSASPDAQRIRTIGHTLATAAGIFSNPDGPSNADKLAMICRTFGLKEGDIFIPCPYEEAYESAVPQNAQACLWLCDLRIQLFDRLIAEEIGPLGEAYIHRFYNVVWKKRFHEWIKLYNLSVDVNNGEVRAH